MSIDFLSWLGENRAILTDSSSRAVDAWARIQEKPTLITIARKDDDLPAQTVRIEHSNQTSAPFESASQSGAVNLVRSTLMIYGVLDHPDPDVPDTDIRRGDRFRIDTGLYEVLQIVTTAGEIQATTEKKS